jgi:TPR repeat protein
MVSRCLPITNQTIMKNFPLRLVLACYMLLMATLAFPNSLGRTDIPVSTQSARNSFIEAIKLISIQDFDHALPMLEVASENGDSNAAYLLGLLYKQGKHIKKDEEKAEKFLKLASDNLNPEASYFLATIYSEKKTPDDEAIKQLILFAATSGKVAAKVAAAYVSAGMSPSKAVNFQRMGDYDWNENMADLLIPVQLPDGTIPSQATILSGYATAQRLCNSCHLSGMEKAPRIGNKYQWEKRDIDIAKMSKRIMNGYKKCPPAISANNKPSLESVKDAIYFMLWTAFK